MFNINKRHLYLTKEQLITIKEIVSEEMTIQKNKDCDLLKEINEKISKLLDKNCKEYCIFELRTNKEKTNLINNICLSRSLRVKDRLKKETKYNFNEYFSSKFSLRDYYIDDINKVDKINRKILYYLINFEKCHEIYIVI